MKRVHWVFFTLMICLYVQGAAEQYYKEYEKGGLDQYIFYTQELFQKKQYREIANRIAWIVCNTACSDYRVDAVIQKLVTEEPLAKKWLVPVQDFLFKKILSLNTNQADDFAYVLNFIEISNSIEDDSAVLSLKIRELDQKNPQLFKLSWDAIASTVIRLKEFQIAKKYMNNGDFLSYFKRQISFYKYYSSVSKNKEQSDFFAKQFSMETKNILVVMAHYGLIQEAKQIRQQAQRELAHNGYKHLAENL